MFVRVVDFITASMAVVSAVLLSALVLLISVSVVMRYYFGLSVAWTTELGEYFIYVAVMLATPWVLKKDAHVQVDVLLQVLREKTKQKLAIVSNILGLLVTAVLFYYGLLATHENYVRGTLSVKVMPVPKYLPLSVIPVVMLLCMLQFVIKIGKCIAPGQTSRGTDGGSNPV
ncbi:MAG: TRAP transporter small permease [Bacillota bacterium]